MYRWWHLSGYTHSSEAERGGRRILVQSRSTPFVIPKSGQLFLVKLPMWFSSERETRRALFVVFDFDFLSRFPLLSSSHFLFSSSRRLRSHPVSIKEFSRASNKRTGITLFFHSVCSSLLLFIFFSFFCSFDLVRSIVSTKTGHTRHFLQSTRGPISTHFPWIQV